MQFGAREGIFVAVLLGVPISSFWFVFRPQNNEIGLAKKEIEHKELMLQSLAEATAQTADLVKANEEIKGAIERIEARLPTTKEVDIILDQVANVALNNKLKLIKVKSEKPVQAASYMEQPLSMQIAGDFEGFYTFLLDVEKLERITRMPALKIKRSEKEDGVIEANFTLSIYFASDATPGGQSAKSLALPASKEESQNPLMKETSVGGLPGMPAPGEDSPPGGGGIMGLGSDLPASPAAKTRFQSGAAVIALVVVVAGSALFLMRKFGLSGGLQFAQIKIDYPIDAGARPKARDAQQQRIIHDLQSSGDVKQVPLDKLQRNPFELALENEPAAPTDDSASELNRLRREQEEKVRLVEVTYPALKLNSVITGAVPIARISGQPARVGDRVGGDVFTVKAIHGRSVDLEAGIMPGKIYTLSLGDR